MNTSRTTLYKDKQNAKLMGVCAGLADYTGIDALWWRLAWAVSTIAGAAPVTADRQEQKYWQGVRANPKRTAREIRGKLREIDRRLANVEEHYVSSNPRLDAEIERLR